MQIIACTTEQCVRGKCGKQTDRIGYESSEQLDVEPASCYRLPARQIVVHRPAYLQHDKVV